MLTEMMVSKKRHTKSRKAAKQYAEIRTEICLHRIFGIPHIHFNYGAEQQKVNSNDNNPSNYQEAPLKL